MSDSDVDVARGTANEHMRRVAFPGWGVFPRPHRVILFWLPLLAGAVAFISLRHGLNRPDRPELCVVPEAT